MLTDRSSSQLKGSSTRSYVAVSVSSAVVSYDMECYRSIVAHAVVPVHLFRVVSFELALSLIECGILASPLQLNENGSAMSTLLTAKHCSVCVSCSFITAHIL